MKPKMMMGKFSARDYFRYCVFPARTGGGSGALLILSNDGNNPVPSGTNNFQGWWRETSQKIIMIIILNMYTTKPFQNRRTGLEL